MRDNAELMTTSEVAALAGGVCTRTVLAAADDGALPCQRLKNGRRVYRREDAEAWAARRRAA